MTTPGPVVRVVDDDVSFLTAIARMLRALGFRVKTFQSGAALLAGLDREVPGCVIADLQMPGLTGLDLQDALAKGGDAMPVISSERPRRHSDHRPRHALRR